ncbi:hypothetical protein MTBLM5_60134 [Magnetospirillum sp. LM-5]|nr:hypothetical protein MTBLM5_60134 [Magnetospirillum sp. LM-5]
MIMSRIALRLPPDSRYHIGS